MGFWKFFPFLALSILVLYPAGIFQAALFSEGEGEFLADALMKDHGKRMASEQKQETEDFSVTVQKRACHFSTCMLGSLADYLSKAAQKNKSMENNLLPESMGRRRRYLQS
ncbi:calcitonin receptor-stimulating peptide 3-like [Phyllostomus hastatus]|uniref:calcitonin receptor-stimulating peptide 3-like n=1 Tax=Phyllostomus hastatus TaxID=9423 RepID=UPI001E68421D|nr:calcitonin receptor-stimulating peptide 3-like [Phyllostomus hastatus]